MDDQVSGDDAARAIRVSLSRLRRRMRGLAADDELTASQSAVLGRLGKDDPAPSASDLAHLEGMRPQSMSTILAALTDRGLIRRRPDPEDGRRHVVELTDAGRAAAEGVIEARRHWLAVRMDELTAAERRTVLRAAEILDRVAAE